MMRLAQRATLFAHVFQLGTAQRSMAGREARPAAPAKIFEPLESCARETASHYVGIQNRDGLVLWSLIDRW